MAKARIHFQNLFRGGPDEHAAKPLWFGLGCYRRSSCNDQVRGYGRKNDLRKKTAVIAPIIAPITM
jgi:hypothetical protein